MALVPIREQEGDLKQLPLASGVEVLGKAGLRAPSGWSVTDVSAARITVDFAEEASLPEAFGGQNLSNEAFAKTKVIDQGAFAVNHVMFERGPEAVWIQLVELEGPLAERYAAPHMALRPNFALPGGTGLVGGPAGLLRKGRCLIRVTYASGQSAPGVDLAAWARSLEDGVRRALSEITA